MFSFAEKSSKLFQGFARKASFIMGSTWAFILAVLSIFIWIVLGPIFGFSDSWQLYANTGTTLITFLMVFLIQNTQNRDMAALQLKLDVLIEQLKDVDSSYAQVHKKSIEEIEKLDEELNAKQARI